MPDSRCCCDHKLYGCDYTWYTELFLHHCNVLLSQRSVKTFMSLFSFFALKKISQVHRNDPSSITFSQLWWNSSQLARLFKVKVALSHDLNTALWFARMALSASVQKQVRLSSSAVIRELAMPWKWTISPFLQNVFRVQIALYVFFYRFLQINSSNVLYENFGRLYNVYLVSLTLISGYDLYSAVACFYLSVRITNLS